MKFQLLGCKTEPFGSYLKALGILRLLGGHLDVKGGWCKDDIFYIDTTGTSLDAISIEMVKDNIIQFFLKKYKPTPIVSPWTRGSGFYPKDNKKWIGMILNTTEERFDLYKKTITEIQNWKDIKFKEKKGSKNEEDKNNDDTNDKELKPQIVLKCRNELDEKLVEWIDAAILIDNDGTLKTTNILGTGGNEGRLDYSNNFMKNICLMLLQNNIDDSVALLKNSLFEEPVSKYVIGRIGKFDPGHSGGYNQGFGIEQKDFPSNPWDFIFLLEGTLVWSSSIAKRNTIEKGSLRSPFTVRPSYIDPENSDSSKESEIWAPIWNKPISITEMKAFFREGRADIGRQNANNGLEFAEAITSLGIDRGITKFTRYNLQIRRGQSFISIPSGQFKVRILSITELIRELNPLMFKIDSFLRKFKPAPPTEFINARRKLNQDIFSALKYNTANDLKNLIISIGKFEKLIAKRDLKKDPTLSRPICGLSPKWLQMADDGSIEFRLAVALVSIKATDKVGSFRANLEPVSPDNAYEWSKNETQVAWVGNNIYEKLTNVLSKRMTDADRYSCCTNPLQSRIGLSAYDISYLINGFVNEEILENLIFGLMWLNWTNDSAEVEIIKKLKERWNNNSMNIPISRSWALLKLLFLPDGVFYFNNEKISIRSEPSIVFLLNAGRIEEACEIAKRRLYYSGLNPIKIKFLNRENGKRITASLLLPINNVDNLAKLVLTLKDSK
ncbi:MAG: type I-U CRISPR-associated protein Csx17 [Candidatus Thermoplasmatota archaeon]|nr:type I-U CRISPR-associated protein Csx17 [Candidatus Thermoplasmatota archaeon]